MSIGELNSPTILSVVKNAMQLPPLSTPMGEPGKEVGQIDDVFSTHWEKEKPISCGFFTVKAGTPFTYTYVVSLSSWSLSECSRLVPHTSYNYNELKLVVEGTLILEDTTAGVRIEAHPGDTLSSTSFSSSRRACCAFDPIYLSQSPRARR